MAQRPNAEELLARVSEQEANATKGRLKIFLGMAAGVGKTFKMLESAREAKRDETDVVAGCVVTHGRTDTDAMLVGLEILPPQTLEHKGAEFTEFDLNAALKRKPALILVDELAHTNAPGSRHEKRWQDVVELLDAGIDVYTCLNIQHLESANDVVAQITRVKVRETVPDSILERAYEIELVDLPPDELIQRLKDGKVYVADKTPVALANFFRKGNLIALRELSLRLAAERVDKQMIKYRAEESIQTVWPANERILVCVGPSPLSIRVVRAARRIASRMNAEWIAAYVETPQYEAMSKDSRSRLMRTLSMAERLGASTTVLTGTNVSEELVALARKRNVSRILIGKPARARWKEVLFGSVVDSLIRCSGDIEINVISGDGGIDEGKSRSQAVAPQRRPIGDYVKALCMVFLATIANSYMASHLALVNLVMIYQLAVVWSAIQYGRGPSLCAALASVILCDFYFVPPYMSFAVSDSQYLITLLVMLIVALTLSSLTHSVKHQAETARNRERRTAALYAMTREQSAAATAKEVLTISARHLREVFELQVVILQTEGHDELKVAVQDTSAPLDAHELGVARWVLTNDQVAGAGTNTLPGASALYLPLKGGGKTVGVVGVHSSDRLRLEAPEDFHLLEIFINQTAVALERTMRSGIERAS